MLPDSTFQIVAYWELGDQLSYECKNSTIKKDQNGNEQKEESSEVWTFEVLEQTDSTYTMQLSFSEISSLAGINPGLETEVYRKIPEYLKIRFKTDENGSMLEMLNLSESFAEVVNAIPQVIDEVSAGYNKKELKKMGFDKQALTEYFEELFLNPIAIKAFCRPPEILFNYHGVIVDPRLEYSYEDEFDTVYGTIKNDVTFWADPKLSDSVSVIIYSTAEAGNDKILPLMQEATVASLRSKLPEDQWKQIEGELAIQFLGGKINTKMTQNTGTEIDLYSGWPIQYHSDRHLQIVTESSTNEVTVTQDIQIKNTEEEPAP